MWEASWLQLRPLHRCNIRLRLRAAMRSINFLSSFLRPVSYDVGQKKESQGIRYISQLTGWGMAKQEAHLPACNCVIATTRPCKLEIKCGLQWLRSVSERSSTHPAVFPFSFNRTKKLEIQKSAKMKLTADWFMHKKLLLSRFTMFTFRPRTSLVLPQPRSVSPLWRMRMALLTRKERAKKEGRKIIVEKKVDVFKGTPLEGFWQDSAS